MKVATVLFTYARSIHTKKVLDALKNNTVLPQKLFIFQDGKKETTNTDEWNKVNELIHSIEWCDTEVCVSDENRGLRISIAGGVTYALQNYDAVVVLEDDCVPHPLFMKYMTESFEKYADNDKIFSIGGYGWPLDIDKNGTDMYFTKRASSWGWGTWKERWKYYTEDYYILSRIKKDTYLSKQLQIWGEDLEGYLHGNIDGRCDAWDVFWVLNVLEQDGYCLAPYQSLIENIGFDGTGAHCGTTVIKTQLRDIEDHSSELVFPEKVETMQSTEEAFSDYFARTSIGEKNTCYYHVLLKWMELHLQGKTVNDYMRKNNISKVSIWGRGKISKLLFEELNEDVIIQEIVESKPTLDKYCDIPIVNAEQISKETQLIIVIPEYDMDRIYRRVDGTCKERLIKISDLLEQALE